VSPQDSTKFNYHLLTLGGRTYDAPGLDDLPSTTKDFATIAEVFTKRLRHQYRLALPGLRYCRTPDAIRRKISTWSRTLGAEDIVTAYFTGHGLPAPGRLYLTLRNTDPDALAATALPAEDLIRSILEPSQVRHLLVILDTCYAGAGSEDIMRAATALAHSQPIGSFTAQVAVIGRAGHREPADPTTAFSNAFAAAVESPTSGGDLQEYLSIGDIVAFLHRSMPKDELSQPFGNGGLQHEPCRALPNPRYIPGRPGATIAEQRRLRRRRSDGVPRPPIPSVGAGMPGESLAESFEGRTAAISAFAEWVRDSEGGPAGCLILGDIGSGKSALVRRLWSMLESAAGTHRPSIRNRHATGPVRKLVDASERSVEELTRMIGVEVGLDSNDPAELVDWLTGTDQNVEIWLDGLDETVEPQTVNRRLLQPLFELAEVAEGIRLVVASRRSQAPRHTETDSDVGRTSSVVVIDIDEPPYRDEQALRSCAERVIRTERLERGLPPIDDGELQSMVKVTVHEAGGTSFLIAGLVARDLASGTSSHVADQPDGGTSVALDRALNAELERRAALGPLTHTALVDLLRPLANAKGMGLPWVHWASLATRLSASGSYDDRHVERIIDIAGDLLRERTDANGRSVYRLFHRSLDEHLRRGQDDVEVARAIVEVLVSHVPASGQHGRDWLSAEPYVINHLAEHAVDAKALREVIEDPLFLVAAHPTRLHRALRAGRARSRSADIFRLAYHNFIEGTTVAERVSYLALAAMILQDKGHARGLDRLSVLRSWRPRWARLSLPDYRLIINAHDGWVRALDVGLIDDESVAVSGGDDGDVHVWDLTDGSRRLTLPTNGNRVLALAVATIDGAPVAMFASDDAVIQTWDLRYGTFLSEFNGHTVGPVKLGVGTVDGRVVAVSADAWGNAWAWDPRNGGALQNFVLQAGDGGAGEESDDEHVRVAAIGIGTLDGEAVVVAVTDGAVLNCWRFADGELLLVAGTAAEQPYKLFTGAVTRGLGPAAAVWGMAGYPWEMWSPELGAPDRRTLPIRRPEGVSAYSTEARHLLTMVRGGWLELWDLTTMAITRKARSTANFVVNSALLELEDTDIVVTSADDGRLRVYDFPRRHEPRRSPRGPGNGISTVSVAADPWRPVAALGGHHVTLVDLLSGNQIRQWPSSGEWVRNVRIGNASGSTVIVAGDDRGIMNVWLADTGAQVSHWWTGHSWPLGLALAQIDGLDVALTAGEGATVKIVNLFNGAVVNEFTVEDAGQVVDVRVLQTRDAILALTTTNGAGRATWDLATGDQVAQLDRNLGFSSVSVSRQPGGDRIVTVDSNDCLVYVDPLSGARLPQERPAGIAGHSHDVMAVVSTPSGEVVVLSGDDGIVTFWSMPAGRLLEAVRFDQGVHTLDATWSAEQRAVITVVGMVNGSACFSMDARSVLGG